MKKVKKNNWPSLKGRLKNSLVTKKEAILQLKSSGIQITPLAQKYLDK